MFTGLIEDLGIMSGIASTGNSSVLTVDTSIPMSEITIGESIAVNGICLTVTRFGDNSFSADVSPETMQCSTLGRLAVGDKVNLERALRLSDRLGGHLVTGHIDSLATISECRQDGNAWRFRFKVTPDLMPLIVAKGSVAVDGISLTVNDVGRDSFSLAVIQHTLKMTNLQYRTVGDTVNIETDLIGKYVLRSVGKSSTDASGVSLETLAKHGFL